MLMVTVLPTLTYQYLFIFGVARSQQFHAALLSLAQGIDMLITPSFDAFRLPHIYAEPKIAAHGPRILGIPVGTQPRTINRKANSLMGALTLIEWLETRNGICKLPLHRLGIVGDLLPIKAKIAPSPSGLSSPSIPS